MFEVVKDKVEAEIVTLATQNQHLLTDFLGEKASSLVNDDAAMHNLSVKLYDLLPAVLKSIVGQDTFTSFMGIGVNLCSFDPNQLQVLVRHEFRF